MSRKPIDPGKPSGGAQRPVVEKVPSSAGLARLFRTPEITFRHLVESVVDYAIFMLDMGGFVVSWNRGAERIKGYSPSEIVGKHFSCFYTTQDIVRLHPARGLEIAARTGRFADEGWRVRKDGSQFWASVVISAIFEDGAQVGYAKVTRDLTERRFAEQCLAESNLLRDAILASASYAIVAVDTQDMITAVNPAFEKMLWYTSDELVGLKRSALLYDWREVEARAAELSAESGRPVLPGFEVFTYRPCRGLIEEREWTFVRKNGSHFPVSVAISAMRDHQNQIIGYLSIAHDISERKRQDDYIKHIAQHDQLTGLPNRRLLDDRLVMAIKRARRSDLKVAVLMLDLDHFKRVNDMHGHHIGDDLLKSVADRVKACVRAGDTIARIGGDEFVIILDCVNGFDDAEHVAAKIVDTISTPILVGVHKLTVSPSIGLSYYPDDGTDPDILLKNADTAMYQAKENGRRRYCLYSSGMSQRLQERLDIEVSIRRALVNEEFTLNYQPIVDLVCGSIVGMEALIRWESPDVGNVPPDIFIPVAEESELIVALGEWALSTACRDAKQMADHTGKPVRISVNVSARQFRQTNLFAVIQNALLESALPAESLEIEITESTAMTHTDETIKTLHAIRNLGVRIAIDDFGVGFSSLAYLTRLPVDTLKIDRSFIQRLKEGTADAAIVKAIIAMARSLGIRVVAGGVETQEQLDFLRANQCDYVQGFLLGAPLSSAVLSLERML